MIDRLITALLRWRPGIPRSVVFRDPRVPIYYADSEDPTQLIREYADGRKERVRITKKGRIRKV